MLSDCCLTLHNPAVKTCDRSFLLTYSVWDVTPTEVLLALQMEQAGFPETGL